MKMRKPINQIAEIDPKLKGNYAKRTISIFDKIELDINSYGKFADKSNETIIFCLNVLFPSLKYI
jgi:hypothetical protein